MSKFLKVAAEVVGAAALALATAGVGVGLEAGLTIGASIAGASVAGLSVGTLAAIAGGLGAAAGIFQKKPAAIANPMSWQSDPQAGVPHVGGRMFVGGQIVYRATFGKDNINETINTVYSTGPIKGFEGYYVSGVLSAIDANGHPTNVVDGGKIFVATQLGRQPEPTALAGANNPGITAASKLSGLAASTQTFTYDTKGGSTFTTEPQTGFVVLGTPVYDPRKDGTYPGGNGPQRWNDETTWSFTGYDNPGLKALSFLIGYRQNGNKVIGAGLPIASINVAQLVEMANVCDANGWTLGCLIKSTDNPFQVYTQILQAGGAIPLRNGAITGCMVNTPKVSLATFERDDIIGDWSVQGCAPRRERINAIIPRYMAEQSVVGETTDKHGNVVLQTTVTWGMQPAGAIVVNDYVTEDGGQRQKGVDYPFVTGVSTNNMAPKQIAQLARYDIENAREFGPISLPMKPRWMGYRAGDVITGGASLTELGLVGQDILLMQRQFSPEKMTVTMAARSETAAKHAFALGQTTTAPPTPALSGPALVSTPGPAEWAITATSVSANGVVSPALVVTGAADNSTINSIVFEYRSYTGTQGDDDDWHAAGSEAPSTTAKVIGNLIGGVQYQVSILYRRGSAVSQNRLILGPSTPAVAQGLGGPGSWTIINETPATLQVVGSTVTKTGATGGWDSSVVSAESYIGGASVAWKATAIHHLMIGLNSDPGTDNNFTSIDYCIYCEDTGTVYVYESGVSQGTFGTWSAGDTFQVVYDGSEILYLHNGALFYSHAVAAGLQLYLDSSFNDPGASVTNLTFAGTGTKGAQGVPGTDGAPGTPGAPGANGQTFYTWIAYADSLDGSVNFTNGAPGDRAYIGITANRTTATESTTPSDYTWSQYKGPPSFGIVNTDGKMAIAGNKVIKTGTAEAWDASVYSSESATGGAQMSFRAASAAEYFMMGLNTDPTTDSNYQSIDYAWYCFPDGGAHIYENGNSAGITVTYGASTVFSIQYDGRNVRYLQDGNVVRTVSASANLKFFLDSSFAGVGSTAYLLSFVATGAAGLDGTDGAPGTPGANGVTTYTWIAYAESLDGTVNFTTGAPGSRAFQGIATNRTTPTESTTPSDYQWGQYRGPAGFGLVPTGNCLVGPDYIVKNGGSAAFDSSAYSSESWTGGAQLSFTAIDNSHGRMMGLNTDPTTDSDYTTLDYAWYCADNGFCVVYENGSAVSSITTYASGDTFQIRYDNSTVGYYHNGVQVYAHPATPGQTLFLDSSFKTSGGRIDKIAFGAAGAAGANGAPGANGANGVSASLTQAAIQVAAYSDGTLKAGALANANGVFKLQDGGTDESAVTAFSVLSQTNCSVTIDGSGNYAVSSVNADAAVATFRATYGGINYDRVLSISLSKDGTAAYSQSNTASGSFNNTGTYFQEMLVTIAPASGQGLSCTSVGRYNETSGTFGMQQKLQYSLNGGSTWIDISGSEQTGPLSSGETETVSSSGSITAATIGSAASVQVRSLWRRSTGTASTVNVSGKLTVSWANV